MWLLSLGPRALRLYHWQEQVGKIKGECQLRLSSSRSFPRNATGVIWDTNHGQPRGWTGPRAHLSVQWGQGSVSKDERVREGVLGGGPGPATALTCVCIDHPNPQWELLTNRDSCPGASHRESECP